MEKKQTEAKAQENEEAKLKALQKKWEEDKRKKLREFGESAEKFGFPKM